LKQNAQQPQQPHSTSGNLPLNEILSKPAQQIELGDVHRLIASEVPETDQIEFKETLSADGRSIDPWVQGKNHIGNLAKDKLLKECVAFANTYGGALLLGIRESNANPPVATEITPLPRVADLADRLRLVFRDRVEPQLPLLEIIPILTDGTNGVVIIRVGRSRQAPHRVTKTLVCPVRRSDRCEELTMREIQDMTLNVSRGIERLERTLSQRAEQFHTQFSRLQTPDDVLALRFTAVPIADDIRFDRVFRHGGIIQQFDKSWCSVNHSNGNTLTFPHGFPPNYWRPILRGARAEDIHDTIPTIYFGYKELHCDGLVELSFISHGTYFRKEYSLSPDWPLVMFANLAVWANHIRSVAEVPTAEFAIEAEIRTLGGPVYVGNNVPLFRSMVAGASLPPEVFPKLSNVKFPTYSLGSHDEISTLLELFHRDFWHALGNDAADVAFSIVEAS